MTARDAILNKVRASLGSTATDETRERLVAERLSGAPKGIIPARGQLSGEARVTLFCRMAEQLAASAEVVDSPEQVPAAVANYLRSRNLAASVRMGDDPRLEAMPWAEQKALEVRKGRSDGKDEVGVSHGFAGIAETGTLVMVSGADNPSTINFLPEHHIVVVRQSDLVGDMETALGRVRDRYGKGTMPRTVNFISGPSRSGDIEQKLILGAHGPRALHVLIVRD